MLHSEGNGRQESPHSKAKAISNDDWINSCIYIALSLYINQTCCKLQRFSCSFCSITFFPNWFCARALEQKQVPRPTKNGRHSKKSIWYHSRLPLILMYYNNKCSEYLYHPSLQYSGTILSCTIKEFLVSYWWTQYNILKTYLWYHMVGYLNKTTEINQFYWFHVSGNIPVHYVGFSRISIFL